MLQKVKLFEYCKLLCCDSVDWQTRWFLIYVPNRFVWEVCIWVHNGPMLKEILKEFIFYTWKRNSKVNIMANGRCKEDCYRMNESELYRLRLWIELCHTKETKGADFLKNRSSLLLTYCRLSLAYSLTIIYSY